MPMSIRERVSDLIRNNPDADYLERLVLKYCEALLAPVDEDLRGIPVSEVNLAKMTVDEHAHLPEGPTELVDGIPSPRRWALHQEGRRRLGFATQSEEIAAVVGKPYEEVQAEYDRRRAALRAKPFVPSQEPFPSGSPK